MCDARGKANLKRISRGLHPVDCCGEVLEGVPCAVIDSSSFLQTKPQQQQLQQLNCSCCSPLEI